MKYFLIAGEASGDLHASHLMASLKQEDPQAEFRFLGGDLMAEQAGVEPIIHYRDMAYMGFADVVKHLGKILGFLGTARHAIDEWQPSAVILVDYPSFNLKVAKYAHNLGIPVYGCEYGKHSLYKCAHSDFHPVLNTAYKHDGKKLQVFQVLEGGVLATIAEPKCLRTYNTGISLVTKHDDNSRDLNIFVDTNTEYVDKEFLLPGLYQYIGTYSYEAVNGSNRTVRRFKQLE